MIIFSLLLTIGITISFIIGYINISALTLDNLVKYFQIFAAIIVGFTFLLYNFRAKWLEIEKIRIKYVIDSYKAFSLFILYLEQFTKPIKYTNSLHEDKILNKLNDLNNNALDLLTQAELFLKEKTYNKMYQILNTFHNITYHHETLKALKSKTGALKPKSESNLLKYYSEEMSKEFSITYQDLPKHILSLFSQIKCELFIDLNGYDKYFILQISKFFIFIKSKLQ